MNTVAVAARTLKEAARKLGTSTHEMRRMGWQNRDELIEVWADPEHVYRKRIDDRCDRFEVWREARGDG